MGESSKHLPLLYHRGIQVNTYLGVTVCREGIYHQSRESLDGHDSEHGHGRENSLDLCSRPRQWTRSRPWKQSGPVFTATTLSTVIEWAMHTQERWTLNFMFINISFETVMQCNDFEDIGLQLVLFESATLDEVTRLQTRICYVM